MLPFLPMLASLFSGAAGSLSGPVADGLGAAIGSGSLFGSKDRSNTSQSSRFDTSQIPLLNQQLAQSDLASQQFITMLRQLGGQRLEGLQGDLNNQLSMVQGLGNQENQDINRRYNSQQGGVGQGLANRGLYNSTVAPGMRALVERERNSALGQAGDRQRQYYGNLLGQQASLFDNARNQTNQGIAGVGASNLALRQLVPREIASSRISTQNTTAKKGGIFSRLFG